MVYESDFYTTRRPYRPSAYSVTPLSIRFAPALPKTVTTYPRVRLQTSPLPPYHVVRVRVRPSVVLRELDRIAHLQRPSYSYSPTADFLRSNTAMAWEDESRRIRADTAALMQRIHSAVPRAASMLPISTLYAYDPLVSVRLMSDDYIDRLLLPVRSVADHIRNISWYAEPARKFTGRGHLACIRYSGNRAFSNRKSLCSDLTVKDGVNLLSFYAKNRLAAAGLSHDSATAAPDKPSALEQPALVECA